METLNPDRKSFRRYVTERPFDILILVFFLLLAYGIKLFNVTLSHDSEAILVVPDRLYESWYGMGRYGEMIIKKMLNTYWFNPYIAEFMMLVCMGIGALLWGYLFYKAGMDNSRFLWVFGAVWLTDIITAEQTAFLLQSYEVALSLVLIAVSLHAFLMWQESRKWLWGVASVLILGFCFAIYQSNVAVYISGAAMLFVTVYDSSEDKPFREHLFFILKLIAVMAAALALYLIGKKITGLLGHPANDYLESQVLWKTESFSVCLAAIWEHMAEILTAEGIFYNLLLPIAMGVSLICVILNKKKKSYFLYALAFLAIFLCPFLMTFVQGQSPSARAEMTVPFVTAFLCMYAVSHAVKWNEKAFRCALLVVFAACMLQAQSTSRLYYTELIKGREEQVMAAKISDRIEKTEANIATDPVVFIGSARLNRNASCYQYDRLELTGISFFEISFSTNHGTWVMDHYMNTLGFPYLLPDEAQERQAEAISTEMPAWPAEGSVAYRDGIVVVKLS